MATLGQLVAGFVHKKNNPVSSLIRSTEVVSEQLQHLLVDEKSSQNLDMRLYKAGLDARLLDTAQVRSRMEELQDLLPDVTRPLLRKLAQLPPDLLDEIKQEKSVGDNEKLITYFETGKLLHNIQHAGQRISNLVKSLKNYSRQDANAYENLDLREGIHDTVHILSNRLKYHKVQFDLNEIPETCGNAGELNKVWTNIIINARDAMEQPGTLTIRCYEVEGRIIIEFSDTGPGIPEKIRQQIFKHNFTTKNRSQKFGLGLGLAISNEIIQKHKGQITVSSCVAR